MSLRRSPRRTPAFLAANRANAQKSTGPRTDTGNQRSATNAYRNGNRASVAFWARGLPHRELAEFYALRDALDRALCAGAEGQKLVDLATAMVWSVRRQAERHLRNLPPEKRRRLENRSLQVARCWHHAIPSRGWKVTATVLLRRGRRRRRDSSLLPTVGPSSVGAIRMPEACPARVHVITKVTCTGHPLYNRGPEGVPLSTKPGAKPPETRTNPECSIKHVNYGNISPNADSPSADRAESAARGVGVTSLRSGRAVPAFSDRQRARRKPAPAARDQNRARHPRSESNPPDKARGLGENAPPWELPEGYSWDRKGGAERKE